VFLESRVFPVFGVPVYEEYESMIELESRVFPIFIVTCYVELYEVSTLLINLFKCCVNRGMSSMEVMGDG
jgi:hypothetical protein